MTNLVDLLDFAPPIYLKTANGPKSLEKAPITREFWKAYEADPTTARAQLKAIGAQIKTMADGSREAQIWKDDKNQRAREQAAYEASWTENATISFPIPTGLTAYPYQEAGAEYMVNHGKSLLGDDMGLGKTLQTILVANHLAEKCRLVIVVCPPNLRINWQREIEKFSTTRPMIVSLEGTPKGKQAEGVMAKIYHSARQVYVIAPYTTLKKWTRLVHGMAWDIAIVDEVHQIKTATTIRSKMVVGEYDRKLKRRVGGIEAPYKMALTGTPIENRPVELIQALCWLDRILEFGGPGEFKARFCEPVTNDFGTTAKGFSNERELNRRLRETCMVRRLKTDVLKQIPGKRHQVLPIVQDDNLVAEESRAMSRTKTGRLFADLQAMDAGAEGYADQVAKLQSAFGSDFTELAIVRRELAVKKIPHTVAHVLDCLEQTGDPIVLGCYHHDCINGIRDALEAKGVKVVVYHGKLTPKAKQAAVDRFQDDSQAIMVFIGQLASAGVGLTLTRSRHVIFHEFDWSPGAMAQFEDRTCRIGQAYSVLVQMLVIDGGFDSYIAQMVLEKQTGITAVLDERIEQAPVEETPEHLDRLETQTRPTLAELAKAGLLDDYGRYLASLCRLNEHQTKAATMIAVEKTDEYRAMANSTRE